MLSPVKMAIVVLIFFLFWSLPGDASLSREVPWADMDQLDSHTILRSQFGSSKNLYESGVSDSAMDFLLRDPEGKIDSKFHIPPELKTSVAFWLKVYTRYSTQQVVLFDSNHQDIIYEVINLKKYAEKSKSQMTYEIVTNRLIQKVIDRYRRAFLSLAANPNPKNPTWEERVILDRKRHLKHKHSYVELLKNLKLMRGQRDNMVQGVMAAETFLPKMQTIFKEMNVPSEITSLCLVESSFNLKAYSKVGASGIWQFMPAQGKKYLHINSGEKIDERLSPLKSTVAAAKLLTWNYNYFKSWPLAIIAYNHGLKNLPKIRDGSKKFSRIAHIFEPCKAKPELGWASRNYYAEFLAALYAETYRGHFYGELPVRYNRSVAFKKIDHSTTALKIAFQYGVPVQEFKIFNADIQDLRRKLPKNFWIAIPGQREDLSGIISPKKGSFRKKTS
jgi:membrane-bound lytic murein transglycosylase D